MNLLIVESPNKIKKISALLPAGWHVEASVGHIRDLPLKELGIDRSNNYRMHYLINADKEGTVSNLKAKVRQVGPQNVYLATDPDREGEAISYHLCQVLGLDVKTAKRVTFQEITGPAILAAVAAPRRLDVALVAAQECRRAVDRLVGWEVSPLLTRHFQAKGYSAGRVQSVATRLVVERERTILAFTGKRTYPVSAVFQTPAAELLPARWVGEAPQTEEEARSLLERITQARDFGVMKVEQQPVAISPPAPYSTSSLQQDGVKKLHLTVQQVSDLAQKLFESGHITYIRTDSVNLSEEARREAAAQIHLQYGPSYAVGGSGRTFREKAGSQGAHEAIRPTHWDQPRAGDTEQQQQLYQLIYARALASQMSNAQFDQTTILLAAARPGPEGLTFQSTARVLRFDGYRRAYQEAAEEVDEDTAVAEGAEGGTLQHPVAEGEGVELRRVRAAGRSQKPPRRFDEATLVAELERLQIGRPSTYASTLRTIHAREYVASGSVAGKKVTAKTLIWEGGNLSEETRSETIGGDKNKLLPTERGSGVTDFLLRYFRDIVNLDFTATCEAEFDEVAEGKRRFVDVVPAFDGRLTALRTAAEVDLPPPKKAYQVGSWLDKPITSGKGQNGDWVRYDEQFYPVAAPLDALALTVEQAVILIQEGRKRQKRQVGSLEKKPIEVGISKSNQVYLVWKDQVFFLAEKDQPQPALETITASQAEQAIREALAQKEAEIVHRIDEKWTLRRSKQNKLYLTNGTDSAPLVKVTEEEVRGWDKAQAQAHVKKFKALLAKKAANS
ncbi:type I DNA topoisomerase [Hymenobacter guriensis]|uniref:DNA topoisomerase 1 n=1 Tax=Hymenobacter guriensis TaxID=2793065 RepID=A0ABS0L8B1_9BACT|nr:type I DNA topoisomerase [Hymenobacter guriensis]MBG8556324.1 type I DNA topoisomerase [Hymenobacter guriensis]